MNMLMPTGTNSLTGLSPRPQTLTCNQTTMHSPGVPFNGLNIVTETNSLICWQLTWFNSLKHQQT